MMVVVRRLNGSAVGMENGGDEGRKREDLREAWVDGEGRSEGKGRMDVDRERGSQGRTGW